MQAYTTDMDDWADDVRVKALTGRQQLHTSVHQSAGNPWKVEVRRFDRQCLTCRLMPQVERLFRAMEPTQVGLDRDPFCTCTLLQYSGECKYM